MRTIHYRDLIEADFNALAELFTAYEAEPATAQGLKDEYAADRENIFIQVAAGEQDQVAGFYWAAFNPRRAGHALLYLIVAEAFRRQGIGATLYDQFLRAHQPGLKLVQANVRLDCPDGCRFAAQRGFVEKRRTIPEELDLQSWDDRPYAALLERLAHAGFRFTTLAELGDSAEAQYQLYLLNDVTATQVPGDNGEHIWDSFADFQQRVCQAAWYRPDGQFVAIDTHNGAWAAMCAITRFEGYAYANTLHIGVDLAYRGRKLGQAVKVLALRYARDVLKAPLVRTYHTAQNLPALAIDRKLGYRQLPAFCRVEKTCV